MNATPKETTEIAAPNPCGGCGNAIPAERCIGCGHIFYQPAPSIPAQPGSGEAIAQAWADQFADARNWPEDFAQENANYMCKCNQCSGQFFGHKRRRTCKVCATPAPADSAAERDAARWRFMMRVAEHPEGPEAQAMENFGNEMSDDGNEAAQMGALVDAAMESIAAMQPKGK